MKLHPEDPRLTAFLLGELPAEEAAEISRAVAADPALGIAIEELEKIQKLLTDTLAPQSTALLPRQREQVLATARQMDLDASHTVEIPQRRSFLKPLLIPLAAAAAIVFGAFALMQLPKSKSGQARTPSTTNPAELPMEVALLPAPGPPDEAGATSEARPTASSGLADASAARAAAMEENGDLFLRKVAERLAQSPLPEGKDLPALAGRGSVAASQNPAISLPVHAGKASLGWITRSIRGDKRRPPADAVRLEEVLNEFPLRPKGAAAISQGVTLSTETLSCPWKPSATLLLVSFRGAAETTSEVRATFKADPANVRRYRLLGFAPVSGLNPGPLPSRLPAKAITSLVIEIEPSTIASALGTIEWTVNGQAAATVPVVRPADAEPSDDARFAALVCTYAQWLANRPAGLVDVELVAALARENAAESLTADRADFLNLIDQSLGF